MSLQFIHANPSAMRQALEGLKDAVDNLDLVGRSEEFQAGALLVMDIISTHIDGLSEASHD